MYQDRLPLYKKLEQERGIRILVYVTGDRRKMETQIHPEVLDFLTHHLDVMGGAPKIALYLYTKGGQTLAAWSIANLLLQFADEFEIIIPAKAHSAGTLIALGAAQIIMTKQATLGPIDPSVNTPLNPEIPGIPPSPNSPRVSVSVEAINGFVELAKEAGVYNSEDIVKVIEALTEHVHPLVLGQVFRTRSQIRMLGERLLSKHEVRPGMNTDEVLSFLCSESGSHDYHIYRREARDELKLNVQKPGDDYELIKAIYDDIADELELTRPFDPSLILGGEDEASFTAVRALVESVEGGSHKYITEGHLARRYIKDPDTGVPQEITQDVRIFEGWRHEDPERA